MGCTCENIVPQSKECYEQQIVVKVPNWITITGCTGEKKESVCLDPCIASEVIDLWRKGIVTTGCCCGHGTHPSYIGVKDEFIPKMEELGYIVRQNSLFQSRKDSFKPMSIDKQSYSEIDKDDIVVFRTNPTRIEKNNLPEDVRYLFCEAVDMYQKVKNYELGIIDKDEFIIDIRRTKLKYKRWE